MPERGHHGKRAKPQAFATVIPLGFFDSMTSDDQLESSVLYLLPNSIGKGRLQVFKDALVKKFHLNLVDKYDITTVNYVIIEDSLDVHVVLDKILNVFQQYQNSNKPILIRTLWISDSIKSKQLLPIHNYILTVSHENENIIPPSKKIKISSSSSSSSQTADRNVELRRSPRFKQANDEISTISPRKIRQPSSYSSDSENDSDDYTKKGHWVCSESATFASENPNQDVIDKLTELADLYRNTNDKWRAFSYQKAINTLKKCTKQLTTYESLS
ncbi:unnamed protein product [Didymodactylos carnosus]|uniref:BRCT domain-containing protein n=1 Tax=Didymodactylos carnosus TaxID=1234261 RepID=A0A8S2DWD7_9BILA|nr:unnamed protein product [Didymodactylos carnosus]CAF3794086.1 unnamed protein product [Didymodactylos carnosus]